MSLRRKRFLDDMDTWKLNPADALTKKDTPIDKALQLMLYSGELPIDFSKGKTRSSNMSTG